MRLFSNSKADLFLVQQILTAEASTYYSHLSPNKAADMLYATGGSNIDFLEKHLNKTYEDDSGDAVCKLITKWIREDRKK